MLDILKTLTRDALLWMITNANNCGAASPVNQSQCRAADNNKAIYLRLGRAVLYCSSMAYFNSVRIASVDCIADVLSMPTFKHFNDVHNCVILSGAQQYVFIGMCNRFDATVKGKKAMTALQCALLATSFYRDPKVTLIYCSVAMCVPIRYSTPKNFVSNLTESIKEIFNFEERI